MERKWNGCNYYGQRFTCMPEAPIYSYLKWWRPFEKNLKKRFIQILCRLKSYSFRFNSLRTTRFNNPGGFHEGITSQFRVNEAHVYMTTFTFHSELHLL